MRIEPFPEHLTFELMSEHFMNLVQERYPSAEKVLQIPSRLGVETIRGKIIVLTIFRDAVKQMSPTRIYHSLQHRDDIYMAIIEALEELEDELEELEEKEAQEAEEEEAENPS